MADKTNLIELHYLGTVRYFSKFVGDNLVCIEQHEHYNKGSYRNRCYIAGANGPLRLSIPLQKGKHDGMLVTDVKIDNKNRWQDIHWRSILSAYGKAPFFDFYAPELAPFYERRYEFLFSFNFDVHRTLLKLMGIDNSMTMSEVFLKNPAPTFIDLRSTISPKSHRSAPDPHFREIRYSQLFEERYGFLPGLSVIDLLFCKGPEALVLLEQSYNSG